MLQNQFVKINGQVYRLTGNFFLTDDPHFNLYVETYNLLLKEAASIFPAKTEHRINQFKLSKPLKIVKAQLSGPMKYLNFPLVNAHFSVTDASLDISPASFEHCSFNGFLKNEVDSAKPRDDFNSVLQFTDVHGEWEKNTFTGKNISFYNLVHPYLKCDVHFVFKLAQLEKAIASRRLDFNGGDGEAIINYAGPLSKTDTVYDLNGKITIHRGDITYHPRNLNFKKTEMELSFEKGDVLVKKMNTEINNNGISINGTINDFLNFFKTDSSKAIFEWTIYSSHLDIGKLKSSLHRSSSAKNKHSYSFFEKLNNKIDRLFDDCNAYLTIRADKLIYKNFSATNVKGKLSLTNQIIRLGNFSLLHAGGSILVNASSKDNGNKSDLMLQSKMQNVNIKELFSSFNNFGMESLTSKNISGNFSADINLTSLLDANNDLYKPANKGYIDFSLKQGRLENFRPGLHGVHLVREHQMIEVAQQVMIGFAQHLEMQCVRVGHQHHLVVAVKPFQHALGDQFLSKDAAPDLPELVVVYLEVQDGAHLFDEIARLHQPGLETLHKPRTGQTLGNLFRRVRAKALERAIAAPKIEMN